MKIYAKVRIFGENKPIIIDQRDLVAFIEATANDQFDVYGAEVISMVVDTTVEF